MPVGEEIRRRRSEQGLSLTDLARLASVSKGYVSEIESHPASRPSARTLYKIANALGTSVAELLGSIPAVGDVPMPVEASESLRAFATRENLPEAEVKMLSGIRYRGRAPQTADDWYYIYESIRLRTVGR